MLVAIVTLLTAAQLQTANGQPTNSTLDVVGLQCRIVVSLNIGRCKGDAFDGPQFRVKEYIMPISASQCEAAARNGTVTILARTFDVRLSEIQMHSFFSQGSQDADGNCQAATFSLNNVKYRQSYERTTVNIFIQTTHAVADLMTDRIIFHQHGPSGRYSDEHLNDTEQGLFFWSTDRPADAYAGIGQAQTTEAPPIGEDSITVPDHTGSQTCVGHAPIAWVGIIWSP